MLNTYLTHHHKTEIHEIPKNVTVNEHRAPTDDSVKVLREMEEAAMKNILHKVILNNNVCSGVAMMFSQMPNLQMDIEVYLRFYINGIEYNYKAKFNYYDLQQVQNNYKQFLSDILTAKIMDCMMNHIKTRIIADFNSTAKNDESYRKLLEQKLLSFNRY